MKINKIIKESGYDGVSTYKMALNIHSMAEHSWEEQHGEYPNDEQMLEAIGGILSQLHSDLQDVLKEYK